MSTRFVDIRQARVSLEVQEGQTILDAALAAGIPYPHGCRSGRSCIPQRLISLLLSFLISLVFGLVLTAPESHNPPCLGCERSHQHLG